MQTNDKEKAQNQSIWAFFKSDKLPDKSAHLIFWLVFITGLFLDLLLKHAVFRWLKEEKETMVYPVIDGFFNLVIALNDGAAFGIASGRTFMLTAISVTAILLIIFIFFFSRDESRLFQLSLGLFAAGISGNLYDRIFNDGLVRDYIDILYWPGRHWPAFNLADAMLCTAVGLMFINTFLTKEPSQKHDQQQK